MKSITTKRPIVFHFKVITVTIFLLLHGMIYHCCDFVSTVQIQFCSANRSGDQKWHNSLSLCMVNQTAHMQNWPHCWPIEVMASFPRDHFQANRFSLSPLKSLSSAYLISRYILGLGQRARCCFCAACPNRKMYIEIRNYSKSLFSKKATIHSTH